MPNILPKACVKFVKNHWNNVRISLVNTITSNHSHTQSKMLLWVKTNKIVVFFSHVSPRFSTIEIPVFNQLDSSFPHNSQHLLLSRKNIIKER